MAGHAGEGGGFGAVERDGDDGGGAVGPGDGREDGVGDGLVGADGRAERLEVGAAVELGGAGEAGEGAEFAEAAGGDEVVGIPELGGLEVVSIKGRPDLGDVKVAGVAFGLREEVEVVVTDLAVEHRAVGGGGIEVEAADVGVAIADVEVGLEKIHAGEGRVEDVVVGSGDEMVIDVVAAEVAGHVGVPSGEGGGRIGEAAGADPHELVEELPGEDMIGVAPAGDDVAVFDAGGCEGEGVGEEVGRAFEEAAVGLVPRIFGPVAVASAADKLAVVLEDDLEVEVVFFGEADDAVPALGSGEVEVAGSGRGGDFEIVGPVEVGGAPVAHPDADPVEVVFLEFGEGGRERGGGLVFVIPRVVQADGVVGSAVRVGEAAGIAEVEADGAGGGA